MFLSFNERVSVVKPMEEPLASNIVFITIMVRSLVMADKNTGEYINIEFLWFS
jgi:hypothetical protein